MLEEYEKYETVSGKKVHMYGTMEFNDMVHYYGYELLKILGKTKIQRDEREKELKGQKIIGGFVDDLNMPSGYRHKQTGKCIGGNTPTIRGEQLEKFLKTFDIKKDAESS